MASPPVGDLDEIDRVILRVLAKDPRMPYSQIAEELEAEEFTMSTEGVRNRVSNIFEVTSIFFLLSPEDHNWEIVRLAISVDDDEDAKRTVFEDVASMRFWLVCKGVGTFDIYSVGTAATNREVDAIVEAVREHPHVENVEFSIETGRDTDVNDYLAIGTDDR